MQTFIMHSSVSPTGGSVGVHNDAVCFFLEAATACVLLDAQRNKETSIYIHQQHL